MRDKKQLFAKLQQCFSCSLSRSAKAEKAILQRRYWEHTINDDEDYMRHVEYILYNPVKHGLALRPSDWPWSSFHEFVKKGIYPPNWVEHDVPIF